MTGAWLSDLTAWLSSNPGWLAFALFLTAFVESLAIAGLIVPGVAILFAIAALAGKTGMPLTEALTWAFLGAVVGDGISFFIGQTLKGRLTSVWPFKRYPILIGKGETFFRKHGGKSVVIGRFIGPIRPVIPLVAGALHMPWQRFLGINILSAIVWAPAYVIPGFLVGSALQTGIELPPHFYAVTGVSVLALLVVYYVLVQFQLGLGGGGRFYRWLEERVARYELSHRFWRLYSNQRPARAGEFPLASLMLSVTCCGLFLIWEQLVISGALDPFNQTVLLWFEQLRHPLIDGPALAATLIGDPLVLVVAAGLSILVLAFRGYYAAALHIALALALTWTLVWGLKTGLDLPRPAVVNQPPASGAFPSGHAAGITVLVTLLASFVAAEFGQRRRWRTYVFLSLPVLPVAVSRLYLEVHWFSDIIGGILLGLAVTGFVRASYSRYDRTPIPMDALTCLGVAVWLVFSVAYILHQWPEASYRYTPEASHSASARVVTPAQALREVPAID